MARISEIFNLNKTQSELDFVDVDIESDTPVFISPRALSMMDSEWADECVHLVQDFFGEVLKLINEGNNDKARSLLSVLREPNETHLGFSSDKSRGRAVGNESAHNIWHALNESRASRSGLLQDLEDTVLMIEGISIDIVSDIATNIIRGPLIRYTQEMCAWQEIPMTKNVDSGPLWDPRAKNWYVEMVELPITSEGRLLLVPKTIVRQNLVYDVGEYYRHYLLTHLQNVELNSNSGLVQLLKNGKRRVTKKSLMEKYGAGKATIARETINNPEVLAKYRRAKKDVEYPLLTHEELAEIEGRANPNWDTLLKDIFALPPGTDHAHEYEKRVEGLLTALFYPMLAFPDPQHKLHEGRKRVDIRYTNVAKEGFFCWLGQHYPAPHVYFECKNYSREVENPELDQLSGRFSPSRGKVGFLVCRNFKNKNLFLRRCKDTAVDDRGFIIALDDRDLKALVKSKKSDPLFENLTLLRSQFEKLAG